MDWRVFTRKYIIVVEQCCLIFLVSNTVYLFVLLVFLFYGLAMAMAMAMAMMTMVSLNIDNRESIVTIADYYMQS